MKSQKVFGIAMVLGTLGMAARVVLTVLDVNDGIQTAVMISSMAVMVIGLTYAVMVDRP